jgi:hypothetical protein
VTSDLAVVGTKPGFASVGHAAGSIAAGIVEAGLESTNPGPGFPTSIYTPVALSASDCPAASCSFFGHFVMPGGFQGTFNFSSLTVVGPLIAATPIPATLPLLVSAIGGLGFLGWRRRKAEAV